MCPYNTDNCMNRCDLYEKMTIEGEKLEAALSRDDRKLYKVHYQSITMWLFHSKAFIGIAYCIDYI